MDEEKEEKDDKVVEDDRGFSSRPHKGGHDHDQDDHDDNESEKGGGGGGAYGPDLGDDGLVNGCDAGQMCLSCCCFTLCLGAIGSKFFNLWPAFIFG